MTDFEPLSAITAAASSLNSHFLAPFNPLYIKRIKNQLIVWRFNYRSVKPIKNILGKKYYNLFSILHASGTPEVAAHFTHTNHYTNLYDINWIWANRVNRFPGETKLKHLKSLFVYYNFKKK